MNEANSTTRLPLPDQVAAYCHVFDAAACPEAWLASVNDDLSTPELEALLAACVRYRRLERVETPDGPAWRVPARGDDTGTVQ